MKTFTYHTHHRTLLGDLHTNMKTFTYHTHHRTLLGDLHTPVGTYLRLRDIFPQSALMESSDYHGSENNRSFIGLCPLASIAIGHGKVLFRLPDGEREEHELTAHYRVENALNDFLARFHVEGEYRQYCGLYGYTSFNAVRYFENIDVKDSREAINDAPDLLYIAVKPSTTRRTCSTSYINISSSSTTTAANCSCWRCRPKTNPPDWTACSAPYTTATTASTTSTPPVP